MAAHTTSHSHCSFSPLHSTFHITARFVCRNVHVCSFQDAVTQASCTGSLSAAALFSPVPLSLSAVKSCLQKGFQFRLTLRSFFEAAGSFPSASLIQLSHSNLLKQFSFEMYCVFSTVLLNECVDRTHFVQLMTCYLFVKGTVQHFGKYHTLFIFILFADCTENSCSV